jgi:hypothetical protein
VLEEEEEEEDSSTDLDPANPYPDHFILFTVSV